MPPIMVKIIKFCLAKGCKRGCALVYRKAVIGYLRGGLYYNSKYCNMHAQRKTKYGSPGNVEPKLEKGKSKPNSNGYLRSTLNGKRNYTHRIIYEQTFGHIPKGYHVHHIDGDKTHNKLENLVIIPGWLHIREHKLGNSCASK